MYFSNLENHLSIEKRHAVNNTVDQRSINSANGFDARYYVYLHQGCRVRIVDHSLSSSCNIGAAGIRFAFNGRNDIVSFTICSFSLGFD